MAARTRRSPDGMYAVSISTGPKLPIYMCNSCNRYVVWCDSKRTGNKYLANVYGMGELNARKYAPWSVHTTRNCQTGLT